MKQSNANIFTQMKNEDRRYGENVKRVPQQKGRRGNNVINYRNIKPSDLARMENDFGDDDFGQNDF